MNSSVYSQDELKTMVAQAALRYITPNDIIGVGTGSTVNKLIDALEPIRQSIQGAVSSSEASTKRLQALGIPVLDANSVESLSIYIDGADEIDSNGFMIKGGGAALTREKIVASLSKRFICIADASKRVQTLGQFPLPVEVIPMAAQSILRRFKAKGAKGFLRLNQQTQKPLQTDNGQFILDIHGLSIENPLEMESEINNWAGVVTVGIFAHQKANVCLLGTAQGVQTLTF